MRELKTREDWLVATANNERIRFDTTNICFVAVEKSERKLPGLSAQNTKAGQQILDGWGLLDWGNGDGWQVGYSEPGPAKAAALLIEEKLGFWFYLESGSREGYVTLSDKRYLKISRYNDEWSVELSGYQILDPTGLRLRSQDSTQLLYKGIEAFMEAWKEISEPVPLQVGEELIPY